jgi:hypothetical protein
MPRPDYILGHEAVGKRPNIRNELRRIKHDPMGPFLIALGDDLDYFVSSDVTRYKDAYNYYYLAMRRYLQNMSVAARFRNGPHYTLKYGGKYTPYERKLASQYKELRPFLEFDMSNCLLHTRILLDRVAGLSRQFLTLPQTPSFTSFSDHKKFFERGKAPLGKHEEYARYIVEHTPWFEMPLKEVRDKFLVHAASKHMRFMGMPNDFEVELIIMLPNAAPPEKPFSKVKVITVNALRMSHDIEAFLTWFASYGTRIL